MTRTARVISIAIALVMMARVSAHAGPVVADVQVVAAGPDAWTVLVRASEPQAFDEVPPAEYNQFVIRLHGATLATSFAPLDSAPFGTVALRADEAGVEMTVNLVDDTYRVQATQGTSPTIVELRITKV